MIDRNDLDLRINAHRNQTATVNQTQWQANEPVQPAGDLRQQIASVLVSLASKLDGRSTATKRRIVAKPASSFTS